MCDFSDAENVGFNKGPVQPKIRWVKDSKTSILCEKIHMNVWQKTALYCCSKRKLNAVVNTTIDSKLIENDRKISPRDNFLQAKNWLRWCLQPDCTHYILPMGKCHPRMHWKYGLFVQSNVASYSSGMMKIIFTFVPIVNIRRLCIEIDFNCAPDIANHFLDKWRDLGNPTTSRTVPALKEFMLDTSFGIPWSYIIFENIKWQILAPGHCFDDNIFSEKCEIASPSDFKQESILSDVLMLHDMFDQSKWLWCQQCSQQKLGSK